MTTPNILWIMTDEQRPDTLGCYGSPWAKTPHLDALADRGVRFETAVCQSPICSPSRASQMTGRYPQELNALSNLGACKDGVYPPGVVHLSERFARAGYRTVNIGKWHHPGSEPPWQECDRTMLYPQYADCLRLGEGLDDAPWRVVHRPGGTEIIIAGTYPGGEDNPSRYITDRAIEFLQNRHDDQPFFLRVSHLWPHTPVLPPKPWDTLYDDAELPIVPFSADALAGRSRRDQAVAEHHGGARLTAAQHEQCWRDYMALAAYVDHEVGRLLDALESAGLAENTIILFSSDHGRSLNEYGAVEKCVFDDPVWRVPFIWSWPGHLPAGQTRTDLCELIDTTRTLMALAGLDQPEPDDVRGRDLFSPAAAPEAVFGQIGWPEGKPDRVVPAEGIDRYIQSQGQYPRYNRTLRQAVRTDRYRMDIEWMARGRRVPREEMDGNLFDLQADPLERTNLFEDPQHAAVVEELLGHLERWYATLDRPAGCFPPE